GASPRAPPDPGRTFQPTSAHPRAAVARLLRPRGRHSRVDRTQRPPAAAQHPGPGHRVHPADHAEQLRRPRGTPMLGLRDALCLLVAVVPLACATSGSRWMEEPLVAGEEPDSDDTPAHPARAQLLDEPPPPARSTTTVRIGPP